MFGLLYLAAMLAGPAALIHFFNTHPPKGTPNAESEEDRRVDQEGRREGRPEAEAEEVTPTGSEIAAYAYGRCDAGDPYISEAAFTLALAGRGVGYFKPVYDVLRDLALNEAAVSEIRAA